MALVPVYRLQGHGDHFYTISEAERDGAIANYGYVSEGIAFYASDVAGPAPSDDAKENEAFWVGIAGAVVGAMSHAYSNVAEPARIVKAASTIADLMLIAYSDAVRRFRGQQ